MSNYRLGSDYKICVWGKPVPLARPRVTRNGTYTPKASRLAKAVFRGEAAAQLSLEKPLEGPLDIKVVFHFPVAKARRKKLPHGALHTQRPDADNLVKLVKDALNGLVWVDDCQVANMTVCKRWTHGDPYTMVFIWELEEQEDA